MNIMEENFEVFTDRSKLPNDPEHLKDLLISIVEALSEQVRVLSEQTQELCQSNQVYCETIEYLKSELSVLRRFQYGQRSERLKKKRLK